MADTTAPATVVATSVELAQARYVDWPAILGGAVVGSAIAFVLATFGAGLGLSLVSPYRGEGLPAWGLVIAVGLWTLWVAGTSFLAAGYITGRLRRRMPDASTHEAQIRDGAHGVIAWGACALIGAALVAFGAYGAGNLAARGAAAAANTGPALTGTRDDGAQGARANPRDEGGYTLIVERMFGPGEENTKPGAEGARRVATRILVASVLAGKMEDADRAYLSKLVAARSGVDEPAAQGRVDQAFKESQAAADKAKQAANAARKVGVVSAFMIAASLLIGLAACWWAATMGGRHRDQQTVFSWLQWR
jgi:hypothetical protein